MVNNNNKKITLLVPPDKRKYVFDPRFKEIFGDMFSGGGVYYPEEDRDGNWVYELPSDMAEKIEKTLAEFSNVNRLEAPDEKRGLVGKCPMCATRMIRVKDGELDCLQCPTGHYRIIESTFNDIWEMYLPFLHIIQAPFDILQDLLDNNRVTGKK